MTTATPITTAQVSATKLMTADEAAQLSTVNRRYELVKGVYIDLSPASAMHGVVASNIGAILTDYARKNKLGLVSAAETGFILTRNPDTVRGADATFISTARIPPGGAPETGFWPLAPDLAVEVISPTDRPDDIQEKVEDYLAAGTRMVWVIYQKTKSITVYRSLRDAKILRRDDTLSGEDVLPGFERKVSEIFE